MRGFHVLITSSLFELVGPNRRISSLAGSYLSHARCSLWHRLLRSFGSINSDKIEVPEYGWTTQKVYNFLNFVVNGVIIGGKINRAKAEFPEEMNILVDRVPEMVESSRAKEPDKVSGMIDTILNFEVKQRGGLNTITI
nr:tobamovirus multiplication protein 3 [Quercus suber]